MSAKPILQNILTATLVICAILVTITAIYEVFFKTQNTSATQVVEIKNWRYLTRGGNVALGARDAPLKIIEFSDYQCPYCRRLESQLKLITQKNPDVAVIRYNFPLTEIHQFAMSAAIAAECASRQNAFKAMDKLLFQTDLAKQAIDGWRSIATQAGIRSKSQFDDCMSSPSARQAVEADVALGKHLGIDATPALIIGGRMMYGYQSEEKIVADIRKFYTI